MNRKFKGLICVVLSLLMIMQVSPISAVASEIVEEQQNVNYDSTEDIVIDSEIESMRTENSKTYVTDNGAYYQVSAAVPIHEENSNGEWEEIVDVDNNVTTAQEAQETVSELAEYSDLDDTNSGFYESETLTMYSNGSSSPMKIAGINATGNKIKSCIYVKPNIITDKSVFINHAELRLTTGSVDTANDKNQFNVYRVKDNIDTLQNVPLATYDDVIIDQQYATSNNSNCTINITSYAHYSSLGIYENTGVALDPAKGETSIEVTGIVLSIYYREIGDLDKNIESESVDLGRAGTLYVNDYTCSPIIVKNDLGIFDELEEVDIQTVLNSAALDDNVSDGANTRTNYYSVIQFGTSEYYWKNCEGDYVYFVRNTSNEYTGTDSSGNKYVLTCANNKQNFEQVSILNEKNNTKYSFITINGKGYLSKITDEYGNEINVTYDGINILYITDGSGRKYQYNYTNGMLSSISVYYTLNGVETPVKIKDQLVVIKYEYDEQNRLSKVIYPDGYYINYSYDNNNRLLSVDSYTDNDDETPLKSLLLVYLNHSSNSNILESYTLKHKGRVVKEIDVNSPRDNIRNREFKNLTDNTEKIMQYDMNSNLVHFKDYNGQEYYIDYENNELKKLIYAETTASNIIKNGDFESDTNSWTIAESSSIVDSAPKKEGAYTSNKALKIMAENLLETGSVQTVTVTPGKSYVLSCSAYCEQSMPFNAERYYSVRVTGSLSGTLVGETSFDYDIVGDWQTSKCVIKIPSSVSAVKISINSLGIPGTCYFDDLSMYLVDDNNTADVSDTGDIPNDEIIRNPDGTIRDIIKARNNDSTLGIHYERDEGKYVSSVTENGKSTYYDYDCTNGLLMSKGKNTDSTKNTQYTYSGIGALTAVNQAITNIDGETVNQSVAYSYDDDLISSIYHNGSLYEYSYTDDGRVKGITVNEPDNEDGSKGHTDYSISYDYELDNVGKVNFGNGSSITYRYDGNRVIETVYDNGKTGSEQRVFVYKYEYNDDGSVKTMTDEVSNTVTTYTDKGCTVTKNGKTIYSDTGKNINLFGTSITYSQEETTKSNVTTISDNYTVSLLKGPIVNAETSLDTLGREISNSIENKGSLDLNTHYKLTSSTNYIDGTEGRETELVKSYVTSVAKKNNRLDTKYSNTRLTREWNYRYDDAGRVTAVFKKASSEIPLTPPGLTNTYDEGALAHYYKYDEGGQVSLDLNLESGIAITYTYDAGGNIASKTLYEKINTNPETTKDFSYDYLADELTFTPSSNGETTYLTYKSNGMTDYLTRYDGQTIQYDESGNPTYYSGTGMGYNDVSGKMTWNGNLLTSFYDSDYSYYEYTYDGDGRRTSKTYYEKKDVSSPRSVIEYIWNGDILTGYKAKWYAPKEDGSEEYGLIYDKTVKLIYSDDEIVGVCVVANDVDNYSDEYSDKYDWDKSVNYTFVKDGQGNITEIYDPNENVIVSMSYDAYGNITPNFSGYYIQQLASSSGSGSTGNEWGDLFLEILVAIAKAIVLSAYLNGIFLSVEQGYKGYIYDYETGLYYGQERYYSPSWGRFINASDPMTLTEDMDNVYSANLFNYCENDPVNNISKTGFNSPCIVIKDAIIPQITNNELNLFKENRSTAKYYGEISTAFDALALGLRTTNDTQALNYWDDALDKKKNVVADGYGLNYIQSAITKNTSSITKYSVEETNTPYKSAKSID